MTPAPQSHLDEIESALKDLLGIIPQLAQQHTPGASLELMVITGIASEFSKAGHTITVVDQQGSPLGPAPVVASGGPHALGSGHSSAFEVISHATGDRWLLVQGVQFTGRSRATHEVDVALIPLDFHQHAVAHGSYRPTGRPLLAIECKDVSSPKAALAEIRSLVAVLYDLTFLNNHPDPGVRYIDGSAQVFNLIQNCVTFKDRNDFNYNAIVRSSSVSKSALRLMSYYKIERFFNFRASHMDQLKGDIRSWAKRTGI